MKSRDTAGDLRERDGAFDHIVDRRLRGVVGDLLRQVRTESGMTQMQFAEAIGVPQTTISKIERAHRDVTLLEFLAICAVLGVQPEAFIQRLFTGAETEGIHKPGQR